MPQALNEFILEENGFFDRWVKRENEMYMVDGEVIVDKVYMFENLDSALGDIAKKLGINSEFNLPKAKQGHRKQGQAAGEKLSQASKEKIEACFSWQIKAFDYKPRDTV